MRDRISNLLRSKETTLITCLIRYTINPQKLDDFELYARVWMHLIEKYGGTHHGYFVPGERTFMRAVPRDV